MTGMEETAATVRALKANASALGLTWNLRLATVTAGGLVASVRLDGDETGTPPLPAISLMGTVVTGARVMTLWIPPNTLYLIGSPGGTVPRTLTNRTFAAATADLTLSTVDQALTGTLTNVQATGTASWEATGVFDFHQTAFSLAVTFVGSLFVDGVAQAGSALFTVTGIQRVTATQQWSGTFISTIPHTFELRARASAVSGTSLARITSSTLTTKTYE